MIARIYLIGAGPGDPSLLTVKGHRYLTTADVVVYDHLVHQRMLNLVRPDAERIDVGPAAPRPLEQDAICLLLAEKAGEGKTVARLKWGDPFVFDSGGKEALFLHEHGLPFEVVPGILSTIGSPTYAGIPVTYPEAGDTLTLVRGHEGETSLPLKVAWSRLARLKGTIVTHAAGPQLAKVVRALRRHGRPASEPTALVYRGTLPSQHTIQGTLEEIEHLVSRADHHETAVLVVGRVVALRDHLRWYDTRPLFGVRVVVTRPRAQAAELVTRLEQLGAEPIEAPTIEIVAPEDPAPLDRACAQIAAFDWVVFTSANAVSHFMRRLLAGPGDIRDLKGVKLCAVGPATAEALSQYSIRTDLVPEEYRTKGVIRALRQDRDLTGTRILLPRADLARGPASGEAAAGGRRRDSGHHVPDGPGRPGGRRRSGHLSSTARTTGRHRHLHERVQRQKLREGARHRAGSGPAQTGGCRLHRPGDGRRGHPTGHFDHHHARRLHRSRDGAGHRGPRDRAWAPRREVVSWPLDISGRQRNTCCNRDDVARRRCQVMVTKDERPAPDTADRHVPAGEPDGLGLIHRLRRLRSSAGIRALVQETRLSADMFVYPLFVCDGTGVRREVPSMPGVHQLSVDEAVRETVAARGDGVRSVLLFGLPAYKDETGSAAADPAAPVQSAIRAIRNRLDDMTVITDVCLCEYTSHGHCGILEGERILNDVTVHHLVETAISHAEAGAHIVAPSDMMDGRVGAIRRGLDARGFEEVAIMSYGGEVLPPPSMAHSGRPSTRRRRSATGAPIRWTRPTSRKPCVKWSSTSMKGRTSSSSSRRCRIWT